MKLMALYDQECSLCKDAKRWFQRLDTGNKVEWVSLQEYEKMDNKQEIEAKDLRRELHVVTKEGQLIVGYYAIRQLLKVSPATAGIGWLLHLPFSHIIGVPIYRLIAKNRHRFMKDTCRDGSCKL